MPFEMPLWALSLTYWLHMFATVLVIGGLVTVTLFVIPAARSVLDETAQTALFEQTQKYMETIGGFSFVLLLATGMFQMSANPNFDGYLSTSNAWGQAILLKHGFIFLMAIVYTAHTWWLLPGLRHSLLLKKRGAGDPHQIEQWQKKEVFLLRVNLVLALLVLAATAIARASS